MRHYLRNHVLANDPEVDISADEYLALREARNVLTNAFAIEEKYEILITNYFDLEKSLLEITAKNVVWRGLDYSDFYEVQLELNIRMVNLLTGARLYLDQLPQNARECLPHRETVNDTVNGFRSKEYDRNKEYRFMEALRNHVQHRGIPIHSTQQGTRWTSRKEDGLMEYSADIWSEKSLLAADGEFKKAVIEEMPVRVNLKHAARAYVESLSEIHGSVRELIHRPTVDARATIEAAHSRYAEIFTGSRLGLSAFRVADENKIESFPLILKWDDVRIELQKRNTKLVNLRKRYVTGKIEDEKK